MAKWDNHATIAAAANNTTSHTVVASAGTTVDGALFTPVAGKLLVCVCEGSVTSGSATGDPTPPPTGWTAPTGNQAVNNTGLYVWWRTATATTADQLTLVHNGTNYGVVADIYQFPAGSTFVGSGSSFASSSGSANPVVSGLTGTNLLMFAAGNAVSATTGTNSSTWGGGALKQLETLSLRGGSPAADGYDYTLAYIEDSVAAATPATTLTYGSVPPLTSSGERLTFVVKVAGGTVAVPPSLVTMPPVRRI